MFHFASTGEIENGQVQFQVKAMHRVKTVDDGRNIPVPVSAGHLHHWYWEVDHPFVLVVYDAANDRGFWLDVQAYVDHQSITPHGESVTLQIPTSNRLTLHAVDRFRQLSRERISRLG
jgi:hypothetical protein